MDKYLRYLAHLGAVLITEFDDDWAPAGPAIRAELRWQGLAFEEYGHILRTDRGALATTEEPSDEAE